MYRCFEISRSFEVGAMKFNGIEVDGLKFYDNLRPDSYEWFEISRSFEIGGLKLKWVL